MTTYESYSSGDTNIFFAKDRTLVLGWLVAMPDGQTETRYALHPDGRVKMTDPLPITNVDFNRSDRRWWDTDSVPTNAVFIGNYEPDMFEA